MIKKIEYYRHNITLEDKRECMRVLSSLFLTTGAQVAEFESKFAKYISAPYVVTVTSCTAALFLALQYYRIKEGDEVITSPMSFIASANAIEFCRARPVFVEVEAETGNIDASKIEKAITKKTKAIIATHLYGQMCDMKAIRKIADKHKLVVIEDCAHCIEGEREGIRPGQLGDVSCFSFYATKNLSSGEGGAIICHKKEIAEWMKKARLHGMSKGAADRYSKTYVHYDMEFLGYKFNMSNIHASLIVHQLDRIEKYLTRKEMIANTFNKGFSKNANIEIPSVLPNSKHARHLYTIWVDPKKRDFVMSKLQQSGISIAVHFQPIHLMLYYRKKYGYKTGSFPIAETIGNRTISLPFYQKLTRDEIAYIIKIVNIVTSSG